MNFAIIISLILLIIQSTLSSPVEDYDDYESLEDNVEHEAIRHETEKYNQFLNHMIEMLNNMTKKVEMVNRTESVHYALEPKSQEFYVSRSFLQKVNRDIQRTLNETKQLKVSANKTTLDDKVNAILNLYDSFVYTMIDIAGENQEISTVEFHPMICVLERLTNDLFAVHAKLDSTLSFFSHRKLYKVLHDDHAVIDPETSAVNKTLQKEISDDYNKLLTYIIEKLNNTQQKIEKQLKLKGLTPEPVEYYDYNIFFNYMMEKFNNLQQNSGSKTQFKQFKSELKELNYYIPRIIMASKQIQANINHTSFELEGNRIEFYNYEQDKISMLRKIIRYIWESISDEGSLLPAEVKDDIKIFYDKFSDKFKLIKQKMSNLYYIIS